MHFYLTVIPNVTNALLYIVVIKIIFKVKVKIIQT